MITILIGDVKDWFKLEEAAKVSRDQNAHTWIEQNAKPYGLLGSLGMNMSVSGARTSRAAIVKCTVTGTQFQQLLRTYRIFLLSRISREDFVADVAPYFQDFDRMPLRVTTLDELMCWVYEADLGRNVSPCLSERSVRCDVTSPGAVSLASSGRSSSALDFEINDALSPGPPDLERERRVVADENVLTSAPLPQALSSLFSPIAGPSTQSAFAPFPPPLVEAEVHPEPMNASGQLDRSAPSPETLGEPPSPEVMLEGENRPLRRVTVPPSLSLPGVSASWLPSDTEWDRIVIGDKPLKIDLRTCQDGELRALQMRSYGMLSSFRYTQEGCYPVIDSVERPGRPIQAMTGIALEIGQLPWGPWAREITSALFHTSALLKSTLMAYAAMMSCRIQNTGTSPCSVVMQARGVAKYEWELLQRQVSPFPCHYENDPFPGFTGISTVCY